MSDSVYQQAVHQLYNDMFGRPADDDGRTYLVDLFKNIQIPKVDQLPALDIISGTQDTAAGKDITTLMSKVAVSLDYVEQQKLHGTVWAGASDVVAATTLL